MEQILIHQPISLQLLYQCRLIYDSPFKKRESRIDPVIGHGAYDDIMSMTESIYLSVGHHKIKPFFSSGIKPPYIKHSSSFVL